MPLELDQQLLFRVKRTAVLLWAAGAVVAWMRSGALAALSLTIAAAIVIFSFLGLEKAAGRLFTPRIGTRFRDFAIPTAGFLALLLLLTLVLSWKGFHVIAGLAGFSVVVAAIVVETLRGALRRK